MKWLLGLLCCGTALAGATDEPVDALPGIRIRHRTFTVSSENDKPRLCLHWPRFQVAYTQNYRTKDFYGQWRRDVFASVGFSYSR